MLTALLVLLSNRPDSTPDLRRWGLETMDRIERDLLTSTPHIYGEEAKPGAKPTEPAYTWGVGVMIQALNGAARTNRDYRLRLSKFIDATISYWNTAGPVAGYDVH